MNHSQILQKLETLKKHFEAGAIPVMHNHEVHPDVPISSRENYLYFINTCSLNFQRSSPATWQSAMKTWDDESTRFVFFPEKVVASSTDNLRAALLKHKLALQPNKHVDIWSRIANTFHTHFNDDPRELFKKGEFDAVKVLNTMQTEMKKDFPYLSGPKLSNYSLFILLHYSDLKLTNTKSISIIPDTHIMKSSVQLGLVGDKSMNPLTVSKVWEELLSDTQYSPIDFHSMLWNWSRNDFKPGV